MKTVRIVNGDCDVCGRGGIVFEVIDVNGDLLLCARCVRRVEREAA